MTSPVARGVRAVKDGYEEHVLPRIIDRACGLPSMQRLRERVCAGLTGEVIEIGFGTGLNARHYPDGVSRVRAVEPSDTAWRMAGSRVGAAPVPVERAGLDGQSLPFADASFDSALSTWTLCTIPDPLIALSEVRRVLKPGGRLHFLEHGLAPDPGVQRWQRRLEPVQRRLFGGCRLSRPIAELIAAAGFGIEELEEFYEPMAPKVLGAVKLGRAVAAPQS